MIRSVLRSCCGVRFKPPKCAVALASLDLLGQGRWRTDVTAIERGLRAGLEGASAIAGVRDVRVLGAIGVIELECEVDVAIATDAAIAEGVWLRPFRNLIYAMPPYVMGIGELDQVSAAMCAAAEAGSRGTPAG